MSGSINGLGAQQQIPLANTFQPGQNDQVKGDENRSSKDSGVRADSSDTQIKTADAFKRETVSAPSNENEAGESRQKRGSLVDITV